MKLNYDTSKELYILARKGNTFEMGLSDVTIDVVAITNSYSADMKIRASEGATPVYSWETPNEIVITSGNIAINVSAANFSAASGKYFYELNITYPSGQVQTWLHGVFEIKPKFT